MECPVRFVPTGIDGTKLLGRRGYSGGHDFLAASARSHWLVRTLRFPNHSGITAYPGPKELGVPDVGPKKTPRWKR